MSGARFGAGDAHHFAPASAAWILRPTRCRVGRDRRCGRATSRTKPPCSVAAAANRERHPPGRGLAARRRKSLTSENEQMQQRAGPDDPDYWWYRAEELRAHAAGKRDLDSWRPLLDAAESCERHARLLEAQRVQAECQKILPHDDSTS